MKKNQLIQCLALILIAAVARADDPDPEPRYQMPPTEVTATRAPREGFDLPLATTVIADVGRARPGLSLAESLRPVPGLFIANRNNLSQGDRLSVRGLGARAAFGVRGIKVLLDGIPLTMPDGQSQLNNLDLGSTGRIEIVRGPSSSLYGNAGGGVLAAHTQAPVEAAWRVEPRLIAGSNGLLRAQTSLSGRVAKTHVFASLYDLRSEGYRDYADARARGLNARVGHALTPHTELTLLLHLYDAPYLFNPSSLDAETARTSPRSARGFVVGQGASKQVRQGQAGIRLEYRPPQAPHHRASSLVLYGVGRVLKNPIPGRIVELDRRAGGLRTEHQFAWAGTRLVTGLDLDFQRDDRREFINEGLPEDVRVDDERVFELVQYGEEQINQEEQVQSFGPFVSLEQDLGTALTATVGGRYDRYRFAVADHARDMDQFSPMAGVVYRLDPFSRWYAHVATAFQTPTTSELGNRPSGEGGFNPDLGPERVLGLETGLRRHVRRARVDLEVALYQLQIADALIPFQVESEDSEEIYFRNAGQARNRGLEFSLSAVPHPGLRTTLAYTFGDYVFEDYEVETAGELAQLAGNEVPGVPRYRLFAALSYDSPQGLFSEVELERVGRYWANDFNGPPPGSDASPDEFFNREYLRVDLRLGIDYRASRAFVAVDNLFGAQYNGSVVPNAFGGRFFEPAAGRTWRLGIGGWIGG